MFSSKSLYTSLALSAFLVSGIAADNVVSTPATVTRLSGSAFAASIVTMDPTHREQAVLREILSGNVPPFLRNLVPVKLSYARPSGGVLNATVFVMPEYLSIGRDDDFLRIPMNLYTATTVARSMGFVLPTRRIVDAIYRQSTFHFSPEPMTPGPQMRSTEYYRLHNQKIDLQSRMLGIMAGALVSGDKKDIVLTNLLERNPGRIAIYGWHRLTGLPIQPLSTVHGACYEDYSHGVRLVSERMLVDGESRSIYDVLADRQLAPLLSDEGPLPDARELMARTAGEMPCWT